MVCACIARQFNSRTSPLSTLAWMQQGAWGNAIFLREVSIGAFFVACVGFGVTQSLQIIGAGNHKSG